MRKSTQAFDPSRLEAELRRKTAQQPGKSTSASSGTSHDDERVTVWNTATNRKTAGNSAPRRVHLDQYLKEHPQYELYTGQDKKRALPKNLQVRGFQLSSNSAIRVKFLLATSGMMAARR